MFIFQCLDHYRAVTVYQKNEYLTINNLGNPRRIKYPLEWIEHEK